MLDQDERFDVSVADLSYRRHASAGRETLLTYLELEACCAFRAVYTEFKFARGAV